MNNLGRTPLAWSLLIHDKKRLLLALLGVAFAVLLMFVEMGFRNGVYDSQTLMLQHMNADLIVSHPMRECIIPSRSVPRRRLTAVLAVPGVAAVYPVLIDVRGQWKDFNQGRHWVSAIGIDPDQSALLLPELDAYRETLKQPQTALIDARSREFYGPWHAGMVGELNNRRIRLAGTVEMGPDFLIDARLVMSDRNFLEYCPDHAPGRGDPDRIELGLVKLQPGADADAVKQAVQNVLPADARVFGKDEIMNVEKSFFAKNQPVAIVFGIGMVVGFIIGVTICYQILFNEINDHQAEFATLKAIGHGNGYLVRVVLGEALYLSLLAYLPGLAVSQLLYALLHNMTGITLQLTPLRAAMVFVMAVVMCVVSASMAVRKVLGCDPAEVF